VADFTLTVLFSNIVPLAGLILWFRLGKMGKHMWSLLTLNQIKGQHEILGLNLTLLSLTEKPITKISAP